MVSIISPMSLELVRGLNRLWGFKHIEVHTGSLVLLSEIVIAMGFGFFLFGEVLSSATILGGVLILGSLILPNIKTSKY